MIDQPVPNMKILEEEKELKGKLTQTRIQKL